MLGVLICILCLTICRRDIIVLSVSFGLPPPDPLSPFQIYLNSYLHPRSAMDSLARLESPRIGAAFVLARALLLSVFFYLPFHLLKFQPISPAYLAVFDTPRYFLYAAAYWPLFGVLSWVYLSAVVYILLRLLNYRPNFDLILNLNGLLNLTIGVVLLLFDWLMVAVQFHTHAVFMGAAHVLIADPWSISLTSIFYKKYFGVPVWLSVLLGILVRILYLPLAIVFVRT